MNGSTRVACPHCGKNNMPGQGANCWDCGKSLSAKAAHSPIPAQPASITQAMVVCPHCGEKNHAGRQLCWICQKTIVGTGAPSVPPSVQASTSVAAAPLPQANSARFATVTDHSLLCLISFFFPPIGFIAGVYALLQPSDAVQNTGRRMIFWAWILTVASIIIGIAVFVFGLLVGQRPAH